ncbi:LysR family transcriptional regulator [Cupriavidus sp. SW-Y-13]|nr:MULTISPECIES: LysR family transcriptional regulator [unclassified Cupriavidus]MWL89196.1 LysR family transcriptional regulator [Cupriavidus sp. SW-Y-13]
MSMERLHGLAAFVRAVEAGSFTAAAKLLGTTPSAVSKSISRLEARFGVRLFQRSTRAFLLTAEGRAYYDRVAPLVRGLEEASEVLATSNAASGRLRVSMPGDLGRALLGAITQKLLPRHPRLSLDISLGDQHVDLVREGFDLALRAGHAADSTLHAKPLGQMPLVLVASPGYLDRHGEPASIADLAQHHHVRYRLRGDVIPLDFVDGPWPPSQGVFDADNGDALKTAALQGLGIAQLLKTTVQSDLDAGQLRIVLPRVALRPVPLQVLHGFGRRLPARAKVFVDFLAAELKDQSVS